MDTCNNQGVLWHSSSSSCEVTKHKSCFMWLMQTLYEYTYIASMGMYVAGDVFSGNCKCSCESVA